MARIDFYVLAQSTHEARLNFALKLCQKALDHKLQTTVLLDDHAQAAKLDALLWEAKPESFLPHALLPAAQPLPPLLLCTGHPIPDATQYLINLSTQPLPLLQQVARGAEIVIQIDAILENTRNHFRTYKQAKHELYMHNL